VSFYATLGTICVGAAVNLLLSMWLFRWKKKEEIPEDITKLSQDIAKALNMFETFKQITERQLAEAEDRDKDFAVVQMQQGRDMVGLRGQIKYIQGILNGKFWKRADDAEDVP